MTRTLFLLVAVLSACGPQYPKQPALPLDQMPGPDPTAFGSEADLLTRWPAVLEPAWNAGRDGDFTGRGNVRVHYHVIPVDHAKGAVVILPGRTEPAIKFAEVTFDLAAQGYASYVLSERGQGESQRMLPDPEKGYVQSFDDYVADLDQFVREVVLPDGLPRLYVLAHSMGGAIAVLWADGHQSEITAMALSSPMLEIATGGFPPAVAFTIADSDCSVSDGTDYAAGQGPYQPEANVAASEVTHSEARWQWKQNLYDANPSLRLGGATYHWLCEAGTWSSYASKLGRSSNLLTLLFQGDQDSVVLPGGENQYCGDGGRCQITHLSGAEHEVLQEVDSIRNYALSQTVKLFDYAGSVQ